MVEVPPNKESLLASSSPNKPLPLEEEEVDDEDDEDNEDGFGAVGLEEVGLDDDGALLEKSRGSSNRLALLDIIIEAYLV